MPLVVKKFGGSSVATLDRISKVARRIVDSKKGNTRLVLVVSAMGDTTDKLLSLASRANPEPPKREIDLLLSTGEIVSSALLSMSLNSLGAEAVAFTGLQGGIITDDVHTKARIRKIETDRIVEEIDKDRIVVVAGFQGVTQENIITTLGRGGSDLTAVALAAALKADMCEIYTDVEGIYTADPRVVPQARKLRRISYDELLEIASSGARVVHPRAVELAKNYEVRLHIRSSFNEKEGTIVE
ncbi:MAG: aspartate kinase [Candidatus Aerophobetes bacterium]